MNTLYFCKFLYKDKQTESVFEIILIIIVDILLYKYIRTYYLHVSLIKTIRYTGVLDRVINNCHVYHVKMTE